MSLNRVILSFKQAGKGGELTHDETTIIAGALELTEKKAKDAMTPLYQTFAIDINAKLDRYHVALNFIHGLSFTVLLLCWIFFGAVLLLIPPFSQGTNARSPRERA